jgi:hypothetical protein
MDWLLSFVTLENKNLSTHKSENDQNDLARMKMTIFKPPISVTHSSQPSDIVLDNPEK